MGKNSAESTNKYQKKAYDRIVILVPKGKKDEYKEYAEKQGESLNAFIKRAIEHQIEDDDWK